MKLYKIIFSAAIICSLGACTSGNGNKAESKEPDTIRTDTSALHGTNDSTSRDTASKTNQNADPSGRNK